MNHQFESWRWLSWFSVWDASDSQSLTAALTQTKTRTVTPWPAHSVSKDSLFEAVWFFYRSLGFVVYLRSRLALKQAVKQEMRRSVGSVGSNIGLRESEWVGGAHHKCFSVCDILQSTNWNQSLHNHNTLVPLQRFPLRYPIWGRVRFFLYWLLLISHVTDIFILSGLRYIYYKHIPPECKNLSSFTHSCRLFSGKDFRHNDLYNESRSSSKNDKKHTNSFLYNSCTILKMYMSHF